MTLSSHVKLPKIYIVLDAQGDIHSIYGGGGGGPTELHIANPPPPPIKRGPPNLHLKTYLARGRSRILKWVVKTLKKIKKSPPLDPLLLASKF